MKATIAADWRYRPIQKVNEAATITATSRNTVYRLVQTGDLELVKLGERASGITTASIIQFLNSRGVELL